MKKILAVLLVFSMMFALVACGGKDKEGPTTEQPTEQNSDQAVNAGDVDVETPSDEDASEEETSEEASTEKGEETSTEKNNESTTAKEEIPADPAKWSKEQIVEYYKQAAIKSHPNATSSQTMELQKMVVNDGDGALNFLIKMIMPAIKSVIKNNAISYSGITGGFKNLKPSDVKTAKAYKQGNYTVVELYMVEQVDGIYGDSQSGTVGHAISVLGNVATAAEQFPDFDIKFEEADIKIVYANPIVRVRINKNGVIEKGSWSYKSKVYIRHLQINTLMVDKADAEIDYAVTVGGGF